jgi:hypothetical protein
VPVNQGPEGGCAGSASFAQAGQVRKELRRSKPNHDNRAMPLEEEVIRFGLVTVQFLTLPPIPPSALSSRGDDETVFAASPEIGLEKNRGHPETAIRTRKHRVRSGNPMIEYHTWLFLGL